MTTHKEALTLALEALTIQSDRVTEIGKQREAIAAIKEALAQPEQEPTNLERHERNVQQLFGTQQPKEPEQEPVAKAMTAHRAAYFMERFKHEEKLLGPNEQAALDFVISMLEAQPAVTEQHKHEPVAHVCVFPLRGDEFFPQTRIEWKNGRPVAGPLYTTPPQRTWVGLTDTEKYALSNDVAQRGVPVFEAICEAEAKLKEKNV